MVSEGFLAVTSSSVNVYNTVGSHVYSFKVPQSAAASASVAAADSADSSSSTATAAAASGSTAGLVEAKNGANGFVVKMSGKPGRRVLHAWSFAKAQASHQVSLPPKVNNIALSPHGTYLAAGTSEGQLMLWNTSTGRLLAVIDAHFRAISVIKFTNDEAALVSASDDGIASVWVIGSILNATATNPVTPFATLSDHTLGITALAIGVGSFPHIHLLTASKDSTVKLWDMSLSGALLSTINLPKPATHLAIDSLERHFVAALASRADDPQQPGSTLLRVDLRHAESHQQTPNDVPLPEHSYHLQERITSLALSETSQTLFVGVARSVYLFALPALRPTRIIACTKNSSGSGSTSKNNSGTGNGNDQVDHVTDIVPFLLPSALGNDNLPQADTLRNGLDRSTQAGNSLEHHIRSNTIHCTIDCTASVELRRAQKGLPAASRYPVSISSLGTSPHTRTRDLLRSQGETNSGSPALLRRQDGSNVISMNGKLWSLLVESQLRR